MSDFQLEFEAPVESVSEHMYEIMQFIEAWGHELTFTFLPYVPAYSRDLNVKPTYFPGPDLSDYIVSLNNQIKIFGQLNSLGTCFSNRCVDLSSNRKNVKGQDWQGFSSTAKPNLIFKYCYTYTQNVDSILNAIPWICLCAIFYP